MDIRIPKHHVGNLLDALRRAGYTPFIDPKTQESSFVCRLGGDFYPRFHLYIHEHADTFTFSLHLDQKQPSYRDSHKHNAEYDGEHIENEMRRLSDWVLYNPPKSTNA